MSINTEFSKNALSYDKNSSIQLEVAGHLLSKVEYRHKKILDIGCGSGNLSRKMSGGFNHLCAVDFSQKMLSLHPQASNIELRCVDFDSESFIDGSYDLILSSSALHWSKDLPKLLKKIAPLATQFAFAFFTANTFKTIGKISNTKPLLKSADELKTILDHFFDLEYEVRPYRLYFENSQEAFRYIKKSGVSGARNILSYKQTKELIQNYPLNYLEFEVLFAWTKEY